MTDRNLDTKCFIASVLLTGCMFGFFEWISREADKEERKQAKPENMLARAESIRSNAIVKMTADSFTNLESQTITGVVTFAKHWRQHEGISGYKSFNYRIHDADFMYSVSGNEAIPEIFKLNDIVTFPRTNYQALFNPTKPKNTQNSSEGRGTVYCDRFPHSAIRKVGEVNFRK